MARHQDARYTSHERLALARALVTSIGNLEFGPEVGVGPIKPDAAVVAPWLSKLRTITADLQACANGAAIPAVAYHADARAAR